MDESREKPAVSTEEADSGDFFPTHFWCVRGHQRPALNRRPRVRDSVGWKTGERIPWFLELRELKKEAGTQKLLLLQLQLPAP